MDGHIKAGHVASYLHGVHQLLDSDGIPDHNALFRWSGGYRTWGQVRRRVAYFVRILGTKINVGDRVCTLALTSADHLEVLLAITAAGGIAAPLNWRWSRQEVEYAVNLLDAKLLIADDHSWGVASSLRPGGIGDRIITLSSISPSQVFFPSPSYRLQQPPDASAFIIFTSGTTGPSKAAVLSHDALDFQCRQKQLVCGYHRRDVYLHTSPLFHVGGLCSALAMLRAGATHVFFPPPPSPSFSATATLQAIQTHRITSFIAVPTMIVDMINCTADDDQQRVGQSMPSVTTILVGAGGLNNSQVESVASLFPNAILWSAYGMTECCSSITFARLPSNASNALGMVCVGTPPAGIEVKTSGQLSEEEQHRGARTSVEQIGEILTRGPHLMLRYWGNADDTDAVFHFDPTASRDGLWLRTGDLGWVDPRTGNVWLVGRIKDVIKSGGENVPAVRVERALVSHPSVAAAAAVGLPDPRLGEMVAAAVVLTQSGLNQRGVDSCDNHNLYVDEKLLQEHCRSVGLPRFMVPRVLVCLDQLPTNSTGKVIKPKVKDMVVSALAQRHAASKL